MASPKQQPSIHWLTPRGSLSRVIGLTALLLFLYMIWLVFIDRYTFFDEAVFSFISDHRSDGLTRFMRGISWLGNTSFLIAANFLLIGLFYFRKEKWTTIRVAVVALSSVGLMSFLKRIFHRHRPDGPMIEGITNFSFPSGHAFMSVAFYGMLIGWALSAIKNRQRRICAVALLLIVILLIGFSRVYLRMHYATDVLAGWGMSITWLIISLTIMDRVQQRYEH